MRPDRGRDCRANALRRTTPGEEYWKTLGSGLPLTVGMVVEYSAADNSVYVATHGRGIWKISLSGI